MSRTIRMVVVLPAPFAPRNPKTWPGSTAKLIPSRARVSPNCFRRSVIWRLMSGRGAPFAERMRSCSPAYRPGPARVAGNADCPAVHPDRSAGRMALRRPVGVPGGRAPAFVGPSRRGPFVGPSHPRARTIAGQWIPRTRSSRRSGARSSATTRRWPGRSASGASPMPTTRRPGARLRSSRTTCATRSCRSTRTRTPSRAGRASRRAASARRRAS